MNKFQLNEATTAFLSTYHLFENDAVQQIQLQHRLDLIKAFDIQKGIRVLEIGCGQGDTTVALAHAVGESGHVIGIDIADQHYGAPFTLGQATDRLLASPLGKRISFHFETDFETFPIDGKFDVAVLSHSSWYFKQPDDLRKYFIKLRKIANRICFAEWDLDFTSLHQRSHFCAASILALHTTFVENDGNIQYLFHKNQIQTILEQAGFQVEKQCTVDATYLQDGQWEKDFANDIRPSFTTAPTTIQSLVSSYYALMNTPNENEQSLNSFVICGK